MPQINPNLSSKNKHANNRADLLHRIRDSPQVSHFRCWCGTVTAQNLLLCETGNAPVPGKHIPSGKQEPVITPKTTKYSSEKPLGRREEHLETPWSKMRVRKVTQVLLQKGILQINYLLWGYLCQGRLEQTIFEASSKLEFSEFNLSSLLLIFGLVKAVTDSDFPSWVFPEKVGQKYSLVKFLPRGEQNKPAVNVFNCFF